jgi:hypothetical protein
LKHTSFFICLVIAGATAALAQESNTPVAEAGVNFSIINIHPGDGVHALSVAGGTGTFVYNFNRTVSAVADIGGYHNKLDSNFNPTTVTYLFGPRISFRRSRVTPYVQTLFGGSRLSSSFADPVSGVATAHNGFATAFGAGLDIPFKNHFLFKPGQIEYLETRYQDPWSTKRTQNNLRYTAGISWTFGAR